MGRRLNPKQKIEDLDPITELQNAISLQARRLEISGSSRELIEDELMQKAIGYISDLKRDDLLEVASDIEIEEWRRGDQI